MIKQIFKTRAFKIIRLILIIFILLYTITAIYMAFKVKWILKELNSQAEDYWKNGTALEIEGVVSKEYARRICYYASGVHYNEEEWDSYEQWRKSWYEEVDELKITFVSLSFNKAVVYYEYSHSFGGSDRTGGWEIPCTITFKLKNFKWTVVDYFEPP